MDENMNLIVTVSEGSITSNFADIRKQLHEKLKEYDTGLYTGEDAVKEMKASRAELNKLVTRLNNRKKQVKAEYNNPWEAFEREFNSLLSEIKATSGELDAKIKEAEQKLKAERRDEIQGFYASYAQETGFTSDPFASLMLGKIYDPRWENATTAKKAWRTAIITNVDQYMQNKALLESMGEPAFYPRALEKYQASLDIRDGMEYINAQKAEREAQERRRIQMEAEAKARAERELAEAKARAERELEEAKRRAEEARRTADIAKAAGILSGFGASAAPAASAEPADAPRNHRMGSPSGNAAYGTVPETLEYATIRVKKEDEERVKEMLFMNDIWFE